MSEISEQKILAVGVAAGALDKCENQVFNEMEVIRNGAFPISKSKSMANLQKNISTIMTQGMTSIHKLLTNEEMKTVLINTTKKIDNLMDIEFRFLSNSISEHGINIGKLKACCDRIRSQGLDIIDGLQTAQRLSREVLSELTTIVTNIASNMFDITKDFIPGSWKVFKTWLNIDTKMEDAKTNGLKIFNDEIQKNVSRTLAETTNTYKEKAEQKIGNMQDAYRNCLFGMGVQLLFKNMMTTFFISTTITAGLICLPPLLCTFIADEILIARATEIARGALPYAAGVLAISGAYLVGKYLTQKENGIPEDRVHGYHKEYKQQYGTCKRCMESASI